MDGAVARRMTLALVALPLSCMLLCTFRVEPVHGWMMRHHCIFARLAMHQPSRPLGLVPSRQRGEAMRMP